MLTARTITYIAAIRCNDDDDQSSSRHGCLSMVT